VRSSFKVKETTTVTQTTRESITIASYNNEEDLS